MGDGSARRWSLPMPNVRPFLPLVLAATAACPGGRDPIECVDDTSCGLAAGGRCLVNPASGNQFCAYPDPECPEGMRWSDYDVEASISGTCVSSSVDAGVDAPLPACEPLIAFIRPDGLYVVRPDGSNLRSVLSGGNEANPVWSPDGTRLLVERNVGDAKDIFVVNVDGTGLANLTTAPGDDTNAAWSPDGALIAFATERNYDGGGADVYVIDADGRNPRLIDTKAYNPSWAPDSQRLTYASYKSGRYQIYTAAPDGSGSVNVTNSSSSDAVPRWSPDGARIMFEGLRAGGPGGTSIYVMNADGSNQRALVPSVEFNSAPVWSPDGQRVAFDGVASSGADSDVYRVNVDGNAVTNLTQGAAGPDRDATWSPDGSQLAIVSDRDGTTKLYRVNDDGTGPLRLTNTEFSSETAPAWSPCE